MAYEEQVPASQVHISERAFNSHYCKYVRIFSIYEPFKPLLTAGLYRGVRMPGWYDIVRQSGEAYKEATNVTADIVVDNQQIRR